MMGVDVEQAHGEGVSRFIHSLTAATRPLPIKIALKTDILSILAVSITSIFFFFIFIVGSDRVKQVVNAG